MADQLPGWADGQARAQVLEFVGSVTEPGASFVPPPERVAAFSNDGTLWCEKPMYPQAGFLLRRWTEMARAGGDAAMLRTARFGLLVRHDDAGREFACDAGAEKALAKAKERGWTVVSMQNDFKVVFDL
jgi:hypothetical protein